jgi:cysteine desulfurase
VENHGFKVTYLTVDDTGRVKADDVEQAITNSTILITIMMANNVGVTKIEMRVKK